jgi:3-hydroxybutyryl-CoA dehydrogenase
MNRRPLIMEENLVGVIGSGTMGSGIALTSLLAGFRVILYDVDSKALQKAYAEIKERLERKKKAISIKYLSTSSELEAVARCQFVIEAAPENLSLKQDIFANLSQICSPAAILATNTSTLAVTEIAAAAGYPDRVGGMHFFNPAPVMPLVEVIRGAQTADHTISALVELARRMDKTPVVAGDTPGFIVNRVARPFYGEALRLLGEGAATVEKIDQLVRQGADFRMGPFELMDLIGIDINFAATQSMYNQTFGEPRYKPHWIQAQMVQQKAFGRKSGRGFYDYSQKSGPAKPAEKSSVEESTRKYQARPLMLVRGSWAPGLEEAVQQAGLVVKYEASAAEEPPVAIVCTGRQEGLKEEITRLDLELPPGSLLLCQCSDTTLAEIADWVKYPSRVVGFDGLFSQGSALTLTSTSATSSRSRSEAELFTAALGKEAVWVDDTPALILPRIICMLANEAAFAAGEGVAEPDTIDQAMQLGTNYPKGPLAWAREIGYGRVLAVLEHLQKEYREDRYRPAPLLRRWMRQDRFSPR